MGSIFVVCVQFSEKKKKRVKSYITGEIKLIEGHLLTRLIRMFNILER